MYLLTNLWVQVTAPCALYWAQSDWLVVVLRLYCVQMYTMYSLTSGFRGLLIVPSTGPCLTGCSLTRLHVYCILCLNVLNDL